jgi:hypothetical protein
MGRNKIDIKFIDNPGRRKTTEKCRLNGLVKKAIQLSVLCDTDIIFACCTADKIVNVYSSGGLPTEQMNYYLNLIAQKNNGNVDPSFFIEEFNKEDAPKFEQRKIQYKHPNKKKKDDSKTRTKLSVDMKHTSNRSINGNQLSEQYHMSGNLPICNYYIY